MRGAIAACLKRRRFALQSTSVHRVSSAETVLWRYPSPRGSQDIVMRRTHYDYSWSYYLHQKCFSTGYSSVHGERPSAEFAKLRKEELEGEFGHLLGTSKSKSPSMLGRFVPFWALYRAAVISFQVLKLTFWQLFIYDMRKRSIKFRETLISLGPFYIKLGQALSTRPDILPTVCCEELAKLQDQIPPFPTHLALRSIESQLGVPVSKLFSDISKEPIAAASLGQVYKAHLHSGEVVAVKVQRPGVSQLLTLDAMLVHMIGGQIKRFAKARKDLFVAVNEVVRHMFNEIDYIMEGQNAERFASLYGYDENSSKGTAGNHRENQISNGVKVPKIYWNFTHKEVLTMEWIDGIKLTDEKGLSDANLNRKQLIDQGLHSSLGQLLEVGFFHADPHPGNLVATEDGRLAYFDFGMMGHLPRHYRVGLIRMLVHFVNRDSFGMANDYVSLGFLPEGVDLQSVSDALQASFGDGTRQSQDFQSIINQLSDVMYKFDFSLPPDYALVIRALGSLEGTAKVLDPSFKVVESAYSFVIERLLANPDPDMRQILRELLIRNDGSIRWNRLERLIAAISQQATGTDAEISSQEKNSNPFQQQSSNMHAVAAAAEDLFEFILSDKGSIVRAFLVRDVIKGVDGMLQDDVLTPLLDEKFQMNAAFEYEGNATRTRLINGVESFWNAVRLDPEVWTSMLFRLSQKPEFQSFALEIVSALITHSSSRFSDSFWVCISRMIHKLVKENKIESL